MDERDTLIRELTLLLNTQKLGVLSTHNGGQPYASLVSFAAGQDLKQLLFATTRSTRKFANLISDARAAMLVDNRSNEESDIHAAMAVTATGVAEEISEGERAGALIHYLEKHPYLKEFVNSPSSALLKLTVRTYYLVRRFQNVVEIHMPSCT
jgi:nitroimidazol reductase NimA-like FMN-containing flavoprotein (pyridoxamine 5'-phosphate oxidase superfamily)